MALHIIEISGSFVISILGLDKVLKCLKLQPPSKQDINKLLEENSTDEDKVKGQE